MHLRVNEPCRHNDANEVCAKSTVECQWSFSHLKVTEKDEQSFCLYIITRVHRPPCSDDGSFVLDARHRSRTQHPDLSSCLDQSITVHPSREAILHRPRAKTTQHNIRLLLFLYKSKPNQLTRSPAHGLRRSLRVFWVGWYQIEDVLHKCLLDPTIGAWFRGGSWIN